MSVPAAAKADVRSLDITKTSPACRRRTATTLGALYFFVLSINAHSTSRIKYFRGPRIRPVVDPAIGPAMGSAWTGSNVCNHGLVKQGFLLICWCLEYLAPAR